MTEAIIILLAYLLPWAAPIYFAIKDSVEPNTSFVPSILAAIGSCGILIAINLSMVMLSSPISAGVVSHPVMSKEAQVVPCYVNGNCRVTSSCNCREECKDELTRVAHTWMMVKQCSTVCDKCPTYACETNYLATVATEQGPHTLEISRVDPAGDKVPAQWQNLTVGQNANVSKNYVTYETRHAPLSWYQLFLFWVASITLTWLTFVIARAYRSPSP